MIARSNGTLCRIAGAAGHLEALKFLRQRCGCIWDKSFCNAAATEGRLEILQYAHARQSQCPDSDSPGWDSRKVCTIAASRGHIHILEWAHNSLHEDGLFDAETCEAAAENGKLAVLKYLRGIGCDWDGSTCRAAVIDGHVGVLEWALDNGCPWSVNDRERSKLTPLHIAENVEVIEFLISRGADINAIDNDGETPLRWAVDCGQLEAVKAFVKSGADVNIADVYGRTPLSVAIDKSYHEIAEILQEAGAR